VLGPHEPGEAANVSAMIIQRIGLKMALRPTEGTGGPLTPRDFVPVLHRFIQERKLDEVMVDVADYGHVHHGPGVLLVCHAAHYGLDEDGGVLGLMYTNKRDPAGDIASRFIDGLKRLCTAARLLEAETSLAAAVRFAAERVRLRVHDRLLAPNTGETFAAASAALAPACKRAWGSPVELRHDAADPRALFTVDIAAPQATTPAAILERLSQ
jgi:hypothetical protein